MQVRYLIVILAVVVSSFATFSYAEGPRISERVRHAVERIEIGVRSGALSREEARRLGAELHGIRDEEARMRADGRLTPPDRMRLMKALDRLERRISRAMQDAERRDDRRDDRREDRRDFRR